MPPQPDHSYDRLFGDLAARVRSLEVEVERLRTWRHDVPNQLIAPIQNDIEDVKDLLHQLAKAIPDAMARAAATGERPATLAQQLWQTGIIWRDVMVFSAGVGSLYGLGKLVGWI
jgi:hypothetical protein